MSTYATTPSIRHEGGASGDTSIPGHRGGLLERGTRALIDIYILTRRNLSISIKALAPGPHLNRCLDTNMKHVENYLRPSVQNCDPYVPEGAMSPRQFQAKASQEEVGSEPTRPALPYLKLTLTRTPQIYNHKSYVR
ncbi:unnamed protein product, partial [Iphiclides podalirius]